LYKKILTAMLLVIFSLQANATDSAVELHENEEAGRLMEIAGNFDDDGVPDRAYFRRSSQGYDLVVEFSGGRSEILVGPSGRPAQSLRYVQLRAIPPGTFDNPCLAGTYSTCVGMLTSISTSTDAISVYHEEASESIYVWHEDGFIFFPISD
jgi:hypothetical protein